MIKRGEPLCCLVIQIEQHSEINQMVFTLYAKIFGQKGYLFKSRAKNCLVFKP